MPGDEVTYTVTVKNVGNINAELINATVVGTSDTEVTATVTPSFTVSSVINAGSTYQFDIVVLWDDSVENTGGKDVTYSVTLDYQQAV